MQLRLDGSDIKKLLVATSKHKYNAVLRCIHIERHGDYVDFVTTDGTALVMLQRPLALCNDELPDDFELNLDLTDFKISDKYVYALVEEKGMLLFIGGGIKAVVMPSFEKFPNYHSITDNAESLPKAKDFTLFTDKTMKVLFSVFSTFDNLIPFASNSVSPHHWVKKENDSVWEVVLMPVRQ